MASSSVSVAPDLGEHRLPAGVLVCDGDHTSLRRVRIMLNVGALGYAGGGLRHVDPQAVDAR